MYRLITLILYSLLFYCHLPVSGFIDTPLPSPPLPSSYPSKSLGGEILTFPVFFFFFFFFFYEWEYRTGTMCPFSSLHPLKKGKEV